LQNKKRKTEPATGWYANTLPGITDESSGTKNKRSENAQRMIQSMGFKLRQHSLAGVDCSLLATPLKLSLSILVLPQNFFLSSGELLLFLPF